MYSGLDSASYSHLKCTMSAALGLKLLKETSWIIGGCNAAGYVITAALETHKITDLVGAGSFVAAAAYLSYSNGVFTWKFLTDLQQPKLLLINGGVMLWGVRLATYLFNRVLLLGEDKRLRKFFRKPGERYLDRSRSFFPLRLSIFWILQAAWGIVCMMPVVFVNAVPLKTAPLFFEYGVTVKSSDFVANPWLGFGLSEKKAGFFYSALLLLSSVVPVAGMYAGIAIEALADDQKAVFRAKSANTGKWCDVGLWKLCRYPNYFGELLMWWSTYFACLPAIIASSTWANHRYSIMPIPTWGPFVAALSPVFITLLLLFVSGIPLLEAKYRKQYAGNAEYAAYVRNTPMLIPFTTTPATIASKAATAAASKASKANAAVSSSSSTSVPNNGKPRNNTDKKTR